MGITGALDVLLFYTSTTTPNNLLTIFGILFYLGITQPAQFTLSPTLNSLAAAAVMGSTKGNLAAVIQIIAPPQQPRIV